MNFLLIFSFIFLGSSVSAANDSDIIVIGEHEKREHRDDSTTLSPYQTFKTENVARSKLRDNLNQNLTDVLDDQIGVEAQTYCANCGAKRLTINGLKGEHTSILIDGIPLHSAVSSFYGVDNIPVTSLKDIQVMRGTGASLTNPEAIGGTLNLITHDPLDFQSTLGLSYGVDDDLEGKSKNAQFLSGLTSESRKWGFYISGQFARTETWDKDENAISEIPQRSLKNIMAKSRLLINKFDLSLRVGLSELEMLGGYVNPSKPDTVRPLAANESDFIDGNVNRPFIGDPDKVTDWIEVKRKEIALNSKFNLSETTAIHLNLGHANQEQSSIYMHGFDYANNDNIFVADLSLEKEVGADGVLRTGLFIKDQRLRSESLTLFNVQNLPKDNFDYLSTAGHISYTKFFDNWEFDLALRVDHISLKWLELSNKIDKTVFAPRFQLMHNFNDHLTQRFSYGLGYRAPLTFFESQHGNNESGYELDIKELERSHSLVYSLSYNTPNYYATFGAHYTHLENMAYGLERYNQPIVYLNDNRNYNITVADLLLGYEIDHDWLLESSFELFHYSEGYKQRLPNAAIEKRIMLKSTYSHENWGQQTQVNIIPSRNLAPYGQYRNHYQNRDESAEPSLSPSLVKKGQKAPTFATVDMSIYYKILKDLKVTFEVENLFDYTQTSRNDSPATWHWHFNHAHYDGLHTWGPNRGRTFNLSLNMNF